ncbi:MAG: DUF6476 family protein [Pseudomonadota bacterium]
MHDDDEELPEPPQVRRLRQMVSALMIASIVGVLALAGTVVIRLGLGGEAPPPPVAAEALSLPDGERIIAIGRTRAEVLLTTEDAAGVERLRIFDASTGKARSETLITRD